MADEIIRSDTLSKDRLQCLFQAAYMETYLDKDGDLVVKEGFKAYVYPAAGWAPARYGSLGPDDQAVERGHRHGGVYPDGAHRGDQRNRLLARWSDTGFGRGWPDGSVMAGGPLTGRGG